MVVEGCDLNPYLRAYYSKKCYERTNAEFINCLVEIDNAAKN